MNEFDNPIDVAAIRKRVGQRLIRRITFGIHFLVFFIISMGINDRPGNVPERDYLMPIWFVILALHFGWWLYGELIERAVRKEIERERLWLTPQIAHEYDKRKRVSEARLMEEDELLDWDEAIIDYRLERKRK